MRFFQGIGATALVTLAVTLIGDFYQGGQRDGVIGVNASMLSVGAALYPLIGGILGSIRWNLPFLFFEISIVVGLVAVFTLDEPEQ